MPDSYSQDNRAAAITASSLGKNDLLLLKSMAGEEASSCTYSKLEHC